MDLTMCIIYVMILTKVTNHYKIFNNFFLNRDHITLITETGEELIVTSDLIANMNFSIEDFMNKTPIQITTITTEKGQIMTRELAHLEGDSDTE